MVAFNPFLLPWTALTFFDRDHPAITTGGPEPHSFPPSLAARNIVDTTITTSNAFMSPRDIDAALLATRDAMLGSATYYHQHGAYGSCSQRHSDTDLVVALPAAHNPKQHCGKTVLIKHKGKGKKGKTVRAKVADTCGSCGKDDLDLSVGAWEALEGEGKGKGKFRIKWTFEN